MNKVFIPLLTFLFGCSLTVNSSVVRIGMDPNWESIALYGQESYVNGYLEDVLLALAQETGLRFERIRANSDSLLSNLADHKYDFALSGLFPHPLYQTQYDFSPLILDTGLQLILPARDSSNIRLKEMEHRILGVQNQEAAQFLQAYSTLIVRKIPTISQLLTAVVQQEIDGAVLSRIPATNYVRDLYAGTLQIVGPVLTEDGIRFISLKETQQQKMIQLHKGIERLERSGVLKSLQQKWRLL